jgi:hypothetical protein
VVTEVEPPPLSVREAARAVREARDAIARHDQDYARLRMRLDTRAIARAHTEVGFAVLEFVHACVALAEAEDRVDPVWAAARNREPVSTVAGHAHDQAWCNYQEARRSGDRDVIDAARGRWRDELLDWQLQLHERRAVEDQQQAENLSRRLDESKWLRPRDAFPPPPRSRSEELVRESRERERRESIRRSTGLPAHVTKRS